MPSRAEIVGLLVAALLLVPRFAEACPACAGQSGKLTSTLKAVGVFMLLPFVIVGAVSYFIRAAADAPAPPIEDQPHH